MDNVTIVTTTNTPLLNQNRKVNTLTMTSGTLDLSGYQLVIKGTANFNGGTIQNGTVNPIGLLGHFAGTHFNATVTAKCGYFHMNGGQFDLPVSLEDTGYASTSGTGASVFNDSLTITHRGTVYFNMATTTGDVFNGPVKLINYSTHEINIASADSSAFNGNIEINSTNSGGILFGNTGGKTVLASGKTITVGSVGFANDYLTLKKFTQLGSAAQTLTLTGSGAVNIIDGVFNGSLTISAAGFLLKNNTFNGTTNFTKNGTANYQSDGGNIFFGATTISNSGSAGRIRLATTTYDTYKNNATFNSTGQDVQVAYIGDNYFEGDITINSSKVVFNTSTGRVYFTGNNAQSLNGGYNYAFKKVTINKYTNHVTANTTLSVDDSLMLTKGNLVTTGTNLLTMKSSSMAISASSSSFVSGPMKKIGSSVFKFPIGKGSTFRTLEISAPSTSTDAFTAEYFDSTQTAGSSIDTTINFISDCGYWNLTRNTGSSNITPKFAFDSTYCDYIDIRPVHISFWNGTKWIDKGEAITDGSAKKTSTAMTSYGNYAMAYRLFPGDAPQMPYPLTISTSCSSSDLHFDNKEMWFSFSPDSVLVKANFLSPDSTKLYSMIKNTTVYNSYHPFDALQIVDSSSWAFDSILVDFQSMFMELNTSSHYLLKVSKFTENDGLGIYDSLDYYLNVCMLNVRMIPLAQILTYNSAAQLAQYLGSPTNPNGTTFPGDVLIPGTFTTPLDITVYAPLLIEPGITLVGNYDLLSESYLAVAGANSSLVTTSPEGTLITSTKRGLDAANVLADDGYMFFMQPGSEIRNLRIKGAMPGYQDYNSENLLCGGIKTAITANNTGPFTISHCQIYNFSYAGIFAKANSDNLTLNNCYLHHVKGEGIIPKGYATWLQGKNSNQANGSNVIIKNTIIDESKEGVDSQPNPINTTIDSCSFGQFFRNENINKHSFNGVSYNHPPVGSSPPYAGCFHYTSHNEADCQSTIESVALGFSITDLAAGNTFIENSIFHQKAKNITIPYPANPNATGIPLYNIRIRNNTFATQIDNAGTFSYNCGLGGYARIDDIFIDECTWDYERYHSITGADADPNDPGNTAIPILFSQPNSHEYKPGSFVTTPQPPEVNISFDAVNYTPGFSPNNPEIPYYSINDDIEITLSHGSTGSQSQNVAYIVQAKTSDGPYNSNQVITSPQTSNVVLTNTNLNWDTSKPGLFGIDAYSVDGNFSSSACSPYYQSKMIHKPVIITPADEYVLVFNIKDSYFNDLNQYSSSTGVFKQVEMNDVVIWQEDIADGGDDWERVELNLDALGVLPELNIDNFINNLTFSIAIPSPSTVLTGGTSGNIVKGVNVWIDDVYLKKYNSSENLIRDGDIENSVAYELGTDYTNSCKWYSKNSVIFSAYDIENSSNTTPCITSAYVKGRAFLNAIDRKSGFQSIMITLPALKSSGNCASAYYNPITTNPNYQVISAAINFDTRDFISCSEFASAFNFSVTPFSSGVINTDHLISNNITLTGNLTLQNASFLFQPSNPPYSITVPSPWKLTISGDVGTDNNFIGGCKTLWQGIIVEPGGSLEINGTADPAQASTIEDALIAVKVIGDGAGTGTPEILIGNGNFNRNMVSLQFENDDYVNCFVKGTNFRCDDGYIVNDPNTPFAFPVEHVYLNNADNLLFGTLVSNKTIFNDIYIGILANESNVKALSCEFADLKNTANSPEKGYGIVCLNFSTTVKNLETTSRFRNLAYGIATVGNIDVDIDNIQYLRDIDKIGISINSLNYNNEIKIKNTGNFQRNNIGIKLSGSYFNLIEIANNTFDNSGFEETSNDSYHNTAITIQCPNTLSGQFNIYGNNITDYRIGIHASLLEGLQLGLNSSNTSYPNKIHFHLGENPEIVEKHLGIWLQQCNSTLIHGSFEDPTSSLNTPDIENDEPTTGAEEYFNGIELENSTDCRINCNYVKNLSYSMQFYGNNDGTILRKNKMEEYDAGVHLEYASIASQLQSDPTNTSDPDDPTNNEWYDTNGSNRVDGATSSGLTFEWYYDAVSNLNQFIPDPANTQVVAAEPDDVATVDCSDYTLRIGRDEKFGLIVDDSLEFVEYFDENLYTAKEKAFLAMKQDSTIIYQGNSRDSAYVNFYNQMKATNIALFDSILKLSSDTSLIEDAIALNSSIIDTNDFDYYRKTVNNLFLNTLAKNELLEENDSTICDDISSLDYFTAGNAIYTSAALIGKEIHPPHRESLRIASLTNEQNPIKPKPQYSLTKHNIIPNPTAYYFKIAGDLDSIKTMYLFGNEGKIIREYTQHFEKEMPIFDIEPGIYQIKIVNHNSSVEFLRLVIIR